MFCLLVGLSSGAMAQADSSFVLTARQNVLAQYDLYFKNQSPLYNGSEYNEPLQTNDTHPFYRSVDWQVAEIEYDDLVFSNVDVLCDLFGDKLVIEHFNGNKVELVPGKLRGFTINGRRFLNIMRGNLPEGLTEGGFYQVLYGGDTQCLVRRKKNVERRVESRAVQMHYKEKASYFVRKDRVYHPVKSKGSLFRLLKDRKNELNQQMKRERLLFRSDRDATIAKILKYYDEVKN